MDISEQYEKDTIEFARENPPVSKGMLVSLYNMDDPSNPVFCFVGRVLKMTWDCYYMQYLCDVEYMSCGVVKQGLFFAGCCEVYKHRKLKVVI